MKKDRPDNWDAASVIDELSKGGTVIAKTDVSFDLWICLPYFCIKSIHV